MLVINAGSSSLKFKVYHLGESMRLQLAYGGQISGIGGDSPDFRVQRGDKAVLTERRLSMREAADLGSAQTVLFSWLADQSGGAPRAVGHRIVHGGAEFTKSVLIDDDVLTRLEALVPLAPLHQHNNLAPVRVLRERWPGIPQIACFDTAFHCGQSEIATRFALPGFLYDRGVRRYGFHGLSYDYIAQTLRRERPEIASGRVIAVHLGAGASACGMVDGRSVDSTMTFTALDGLPMATRPGRLDPGVVLWMVEQGYSHERIQHLLYYESGLQGLSGLSGDTRDLLASDRPSARLALDYFAFRTAECIAGLCVATRGLDALVFTAGMGENSPPIRSAICAHLDWLGIELDDALNLTSAPCISTRSSHVAVYVIPTDEESVIAQQTLAEVMERPEAITRARTPYSPGKA